MTADGRACPVSKPQGPQIRRGQVGGVLPDGHQAPAACEHSRHGQGQDREQAVAHAPPIPGVGDVPKEPGPGADATGRSWWKMTSARAPRAKELIRHNSSSLRGPRPRPNDTPPIKTAQTPSPTNFADPLRSRGSCGRPSGPSRTTTTRASPGSLRSSPVRNERAVLEPVRRAHWEANS